MKLPLLHQPNRQILMPILLTLTFLSLTAQDGKSVRPDWDLQDSRLWSERFNDSTSWDTATLNMETRFAEALLQYDTPLRLTPFPTPKYDSPGNGNASTQVEIEGDLYHLQYAFVARGDHNEYLFDDPGKQSAVYFALIGPSNGQDPLDFPMLASSRNHPHYLAQGSMHTESPMRIDWIAMQMANNTAYAVINGRLFDLSVGRFILARTLANGTIRFHQLDAGIKDESEVETTLHKVLSSEEAKRFFEPKN